MRLFPAFLSGVLFAFGLAIGGMTDPRKVIAFLDFAGDWDPSLAFVMGGAVLVFSLAIRWSRRRTAPLFGDAFRLPTRRDIDTPLVAGAALFGIGWGLGGYCPGPALVGAMSFQSGALLFTGSMLAGMAIFSAWQRMKSRGATPRDGGSA